MYENKRIYIWGPVILASTLIIGILIGIRLKNNSFDIGQHVTMHSSANKISYILDLIEQDYVDSVSRADLIEKILPVLMENLDPHSVYIPPVELQAHTESLEGNFEGIGVQFNLQNDTILIINTISGGPSEKIGILAGDRIVKINDSIVAGIKMDTENIVKRLKGPRGTKVKVGIQRTGIADLVDFEITRDKIPLYSVDVSYMITSSIGYIKLSKFARTTYEEFVAAMDGLQEKGMKSLILDLRGNGGGYLEQATDLTDEFLPKESLIVYTEGRSRKKTEYFATANDMFTEGELVILIDEYSASASEILAGAIQDNDRGTIIGRRSFGKGLVQEPIEFRDGSGIRLTTARYYTPSGRCIQKPYNNGNDQYFHDINDRFIHGEFEQKDSIHLTDTVKYSTLRGRIVYGGGGIMPDIFIPLDTIGYTKYFNDITSKGLIYQFALEFADKNRAELNKFTDYKSMITFLENRNVYNQFLVYATKKGVARNETDLQKSGKIIKTQIFAYIARNTKLDSEGFYPIIMAIDNTLLKAVEVISKPK